MTYWKFLKPSVDEGVCNYDSGNDIDISESKESIASVINSENEENEGLMCDATAERSRLEDRDDW